MLHSTDAHAPVVGDDGDPFAVTVTVTQDLPAGAALGCDTNDGCNPSCASSCTSLV